MPRHEVQQVDQQQITEYRLQITKWTHKGGAPNGAKLGSMGIIHHARLINIIIKSNCYDMPGKSAIGAAPLVRSWYGMYQQGGTTYDNLHLC